MATLLLAGAGAALGGSVGGGLFGLSSMVLGKAVGATLGSVIDQRLLGSGSEPIETGKVERFRVMGSSEGAGLARVFGRTRVAGQLIWSSRFLERVSTEDVGGKGGGGGGTTVREYSYSVSVAVALCEGEVMRVGRIWADGQPVDQSGLTWRLHRGTEYQLADPLISAIEGVDAAPAYRGTAYVVIETLELGLYGNRIPQFAFEVFRRPSVRSDALPRPPSRDIRGVALVPGTGEYALATEPVYRERGKGDNSVLNVHNDEGRPDFLVSLDQLNAELPKAKAISLVVSWFGDDLRCDRCTLRPKVEQTADDGESMTWRVSGLPRSEALAVSRKDGRPVFGGTPTDASVTQAIARMRARGHEVMFYPFILMDILENNGLADPWSDQPDQPPVPWRGRITLSSAPGRAGSPDKTPAAADEVASFFGEAKASDFDVAGSSVTYTGPGEWSYRRFILHYAHLCAASGGVDAFCIGSELRSLTQIRDGTDSYPVVRALRDLAADVRGILGPDTKIGYAADWSEYFGHQPSDGSGDVLFHLDPLWAHSAIDFVGIDNYMPLSDWRDSADHLDAPAGSIYDLDYLAGNVAGGEGFDWYYADPAGREDQVRLPISDGAYGEDWVFRYKDLVNWWSQPHVNRIDGQKVAAATEWQPGSKPIWFTELGCPAVDKGTNQPNVFHDPKSSESFFPYHSNGARDDFIQHRYLQAMYRHWSDADNNPMSASYGGRMVDMDHAYVWAWDARPWPDFPNRTETWIDGANYARGHWLNGRASLSSLAEVVAEICERAALDDIDLADLYGTVTGYSLDGVETGRQSLQPLMLAFGFDSFSRGEKVVFSTRGHGAAHPLDPSRLAVLGSEPVQSMTRAPDAEMPGRVTFSFVRADLDYAVGAAEAIAADEAEPHTTQSSLPIVLSEGEAQGIAARWLHEGRIAREMLTCALPLSTLSISTGDLIVFGASHERRFFRVDRVEELGHRPVSAVRVESGVYRSSPPLSATPTSPAILAASPVYSEFLDLPLLRGDESPVAPHVAVAKTPWTGPVAVYSSSSDYDYTLNIKLKRPAVFGELLDPLPAGQAGLWMPRALRVRLASGSLQSRSTVDVLNGANVAALRSGGAGDWEVIQFRDAQLIAPREYRLDGLLRGQAGTDGIVPGEWPVGTDFVLLDGAVQQIDLPSSARDLARHYRIGPVSRPYDDASYSHRTEAFAGIGTRPYRPCHLSARRVPDGSIHLAWIRRTRLDGDNWQGLDVPIGEQDELYHVRLFAGAVAVREYVSGQPRQVYSVLDQVSDGNPSPLIVEVAQISDRFGPGPYERITFDG